MEVLILCNKPPFPPVDGGTIAMRQTIEKLIDEGVSLKVLSVSTKKHPFKPRKEDEHLLRSCGFEHIFINTEVSPAGALINLLKSSSYNIDRFFSKDFEKRLVEILKEKKYDIVHFESLFMLPYLETVRKNSNAKTVLRSHNCESLLWKRRTEETKGIKKPYLSILTKRLEKSEKEAIPQFDSVAAISSEDEKIFMGWNARTTAVIPFGVQSEKQNFRNEEHLSLFFIGAMDWQPNVEGLNWFLENVWPAFRLEFRNIKFYIAGRKLDPSLGGENVINCGEVEDSSDFINEHSILIAPYFSGGGMRIKIAQALATGKPVVTTSIGAEGLTECIGQGIFTADDASRFLQTLRKLVTDDKARIAAGKAAEKCVLKHYGAEETGKKFIELYKETLKQ